MNSSLDVLMLLRRVLAEVGGGRGVSGALVMVFSGAGRGLDSVARASLLGYPPREALRSLMRGEGREVAMLASLVVNGARGNARLAGTKGERLSVMLEDWIKAREGRRLEQKVVRFRGMIVSAVLGAVLGMVSSVGPLVGGLSFTAPLPAADPVYIGVASAAMAGLSSGMLGLYMSGRGFVVNVAAALIAFGLVTAGVSPLTSAASTNLWAIK